MQNRRISDFEEKVYRAVSRVPRGHVTTYGIVARYLGCGSPRAVGQALRRNPFAPRVPCHRVISSDLSVGGFRGRKYGSAPAEKAMLLRREGVKLIDGRLGDRERLYTFECETGDAGVPAACHDIVRGGADG
jgi:methylated-DNA-[protein]-cysteine S-methyltransferase